MSNKLSVTIGILAFNEEDTIVQLLKSILSQHENTFSVKKILLVSDGSTDKTVIKAKSVKSKKIKIIDGKENLGRVARRNQIVRLSTTDILVFLDADGILENKNSLSELLKTFLSDKKVAVVGGNPYSVGENTFLIKSFSLPRDIYTHVRYQINNGNNIFGCMGGMFAMKRSFYKTITIPSDIMADDAYIYFSCIKKGFIFKNAKNARIIHKFPATLAEHIKRNRRHVQSGSELKKYFSQSLIHKEFTLPRQIVLKEACREFLHYPFHTVFIYGVNTYARFLAKI